MQNVIENSTLTEKIIKIEEIEYEGYVYDACCDFPHLYLTNTFISHNCVLWIDEIEKAISGVNSSGRTDGTTSRVIGTFLTWMQEKESPVFVVATANDHKSIPPEFLRAGRFDEIFFVDLPDNTEREEICEVLLRKKGYVVENFDTIRLATTCKNYSGAEIEKAIDKAMLAGFLDNGRIITTEDIETAMRDFKPLSQMRAEDFEELKEWAKERCVKASISEKEILAVNNFKPAEPGKHLDIEDND